MQRLQESLGVEDKKALIGKLKRLDVSAGTVSNWMVRGISREGALSAAKVFGLDATYIIDGGEMPVLPIQFMSFAVLPFYRRRKIPMVSEMTYANRHNLLKIDDRSIIKGWMEQPERLSTQSLVFIVSGHRMQPEFSPGEKLYIEMAVNKEDVKDEAFVLVQHKESEYGVLKKVVYGDSNSDVYLIDLNTNLPASKVASFDEYDLIGIVDSKITMYR